MEFTKLFVPLLKRLLFLVLAPIYGGLYFFMNSTFKWWESLGGITR